MIKTVARFVTRLQGKGDGLFIGALMLEGAFKPNTVYEIQEVMGTYLIKEVGMAGGAGGDNCISNSMSDGKALFHWGSEIGYILASFGKYMFLTLEELKTLYRLEELKTLYRKDAENDYQG